jgi:hypothetical protein
MSKLPENSPPPAHLRPLAIEIPRSWTPEEALAVFELIDDLRDKIWALYSWRLQATLREQGEAGNPVDSDDALDAPSF